MKFQDDISNMNMYVRTYVRTSRNQYVPYFFKVGGIKMYSPFKPHFYYIKVGCKGVFVTRTCFRDVMGIQYLCFNGEKTKITKYPPIQTVTILSFQAARPWKK